MLRPGACSHETLETDALAPWARSLISGYNDRPLDFNNRVQQLVPVYQIAQPIPLPRYNYVTGAGGPAPENVRRSLLSIPDRVRAADTKHVCRHRSSKSLGPTPPSSSRFTPSQDSTPWRIAISLNSGSKSWTVSEALQILLRFGC